MWKSQKPRVKLKDTLGPQKWENHIRGLRGAVSFWSNFPSTRLTQCYTERIPCAYGFSRGKIEKKVDFQLLSITKCFLWGSLTSCLTGITGEISGARSLGISYWWKEGQLTATSMHISLDYISAYSSSQVESLANDSADLKSWASGPIWPSSMVDSST